MRRYFSLLLLLSLLTVANTGFAEEGSSSSGGGSSVADSGSTSTSSTSEPTGATTGLNNVDEELANGPIASDSIYEYSAGIGFGFEYDDNIDSDADNRISAFMTHIRPSFSFKRLGGRIEADISYSGDYTFYLQERHIPEYQHTIDASITAEVWKNLFFINVSENMQQVYDDVTRGEFQEGDDDDDARNRNTITIAPYFSLQPSERTNITLGYTFTDTRYSANQTGEVPYFLSIDGEQYDFSHNVSQTHNFHFKVNHELSDRAFLYTGGSYTRVVNDDTEEDPNTTRYNLYVGGAYEFSENLSASLEIGPNYSVPDVGDASLTPYVQASLNYSIGRSVFSLSYNTSFEDDPSSGNTVYKSSYDFGWNKSFDRSKLSLGLAYNTYVTEVTNKALSGNSDEQGNTFSPKVNFSYELTDRLSAFLGYNAVIYEDHTLGEHSHTGNYGLRYELSPESTVSLSHRVEYAIPYDEEAYFANKVSLDFNYTF